MIGGRAPGREAGVDGREGRGGAWIGVCGSVAPCPGVWCTCCSNRAIMPISNVINQSEICELVYCLPSCDT